MVSTVEQVGPRDGLTGKPPTGDEVFDLVLEFTDRLDKLGLSGAIVVRCALDAGSVEVRGHSDAWNKAGSPWPRR